MDCWLFSSIFWWNKISIRYYKSPDQIHYWNIYIMYFSTKEIHLKPEIMTYITYRLFHFLFVFPPRNLRKINPFLTYFIHIGWWKTPRILTYWVGTLPSNSGKWRLYGDAPSYINPINNNFLFVLSIPYDVSSILRFETQKKQLFVRRWPVAMQIQQRFSGESLSFCLDFGSERSWLLTITGWWFQILALAQGASQALQGGP